MKSLNNKKTLGIVILGVGVITFILAFLQSLPGSDTLLGPTVYAGLHKIFLTLAVVFIALSVAYAVELAISLMQWLIRSVKASKPQLKTLEQDYTWRRIKVAYGVFSVIIVLISVGSAYTDSAENGPYYTPSATAGLTALLLSTFLTWIFYRLVLTKAYSYLKKPEK